ncbi:alpha/beta hydrolase [Dyella telluris]|uniref:Alpha/beta hydrolase n=1 Tax=Dyella telluris TaxID=2763498 RepID=A0A7G8Q818_9GAMM|nr:alpha/beta hydrolase [Dyella telluris]QNK02926.1 alpha/beta hydrolase [Dyella telluris]
MFVRTLLVLAALAVLFYGGVCLFLYLGQRQQIYHPEMTWRVQQRPDFELVNGGVHLRGWVMNPGHAKALLYFGGNGERIEDSRDDLARWFPDRTIYLLPYRGYAASDGRPGETALVGDATALFDHVAKAHGQVAVIGRSLGTGVAVQLAAKRPVERLALVTPFDSLVRVAAGYFPWLPVNALMRDRYESWRYVNAIHCPVLVIRAEDDEVIPTARTQALIRAFAPPPAEQVIADAGHNTVQDHADYRVSLERFLQ